MSLFGKSDTLPALIKRLTDSPRGGAELEALLKEIETHPELDPTKVISLVTHSNPKIKEFATRVLTTAKDRTIPDLLVRELVGKPAPARAELARLAVQLGAERVKFLLGPMIHAQKPEQREAALELIASYPRWNEFLGHVRTVLADPVPQIRHRAVRLLRSAVANPTIFLLLRGLINDEDATVRGLVIDALAQTQSPDIVEPFFERLALEGPSERATMIRALSALARSGAVKMEDRLLPVLGDENPDLREAAARLLSDMPGRTEVLRAFLVHCRGLSFWIRDRSIQSIQRMGGDLVEAFAVLMQDPDEDIQVGAMMMAQGSKDPRILPHARAIFVSKHDWWVRSMAASVLAHFPASDVIDILLSRLHDGELRYSVIHALGKLGGDLVVPHLLDCLTDPQRGIRMAALDALANSRGPDVLEVLARLAQSDRDDGVREKCIVMLQAFGARGAQVVAELESRRKGPELVATGETTELSMANESLNKKG
jgi:HEAT repeat protein